MLDRSLLFALVLTLGCGTPEAPPALEATPAPPASLCGAGDDGSEVIARAGDVVVSRAELDAAIQRLPARARGRYEDLAPQRVLAARLIEERLLCRAAEAAGIDATAVARRAAEEAIAALYVDSVESAALTDEAIQRYYDSNSARYELAVVDTAHIVVPTKERAQELLRELRAGAEFANVAMQHSTDKRSGPKGGKVGWISRGRMNETWTDAAFALEPGQVSEPVQTSAGWHLITITDRRDTQPLEEVRPGIERKLRGHAAEGLMKQVASGVTIQLQGSLQSAQAGPDDPTP